MAADAAEEGGGADGQGEYLPVPLGGLGGGKQVLPFPLYLRTGFGQCVLYRPENERLGLDHVDRLRAEGVNTLFIRQLDTAAYARQIENSLDDILKDRAIPVEQRAAILHGVAIEVVQDLFVAPSVDGISRSRKLLGTTASLVTRDRNAFAALRGVLEGSEHLALHSMTVAFLSMGLAQEMLGPDPEVLLHAGMAGFLHDIGHQPGAECDINDPEHPQRGHDLLRKLGLPSDVCEAVMCHHERMDGSGYPFGLQGNDIPKLARIVGFVNTFHRVYTQQVRQDPVAIFESLRIVAQLYRGCFDEQVVRRFVRVFSR